METLQIDKANALKAHENATIKGKSLLENLFGKKVFLKNVTERIKTFEDVLIDNNKTETQFLEECNGLERDEICYRILKLIAKSLNEGWVPDWSNSSEYKYFAYFKMGSPSGVGFSCGGFDCWRTCSRVGSRLCYKSSELATYAGQTFENIYKEFLTINQ